jgi:hypothetical protein
MLQLPESQELREFPTEGVSEVFQFCLDEVSIISRKIILRLDVLRI